MTRQDRHRARIYDAARVIAWTDGYPPSELVGDQATRWPLYLEHARLALQDIDTDELQPNQEGII